MIRTDDDHYTLDSGRVIYANCGIIGLVAEAEEGVFDISHGYDGGWDLSDWTTAERLDLAQFMVARWNEHVAALQRVRDGE